MIFGLDDFNIDFFIDISDENIYIYQEDLQSIPSLANLIPLEAFDEEGKFLLRNIPDLKTRNEIGLEFMLRDQYARPLGGVPANYAIKLYRFYEEFKILVEVKEFFEQNFFNRCEGANPESWCQNCTNSIIKCPDYCTDPYCALTVPYLEFKDPAVAGPNDLTYEQFYFLVKLYFSGIYRNTPGTVQELGIYDILTDINFEINNYSMILDIKEFFTKEFTYFLQTFPGSIPFNNEYGTIIKKVVQTKNTEIQHIFVQNELESFIINFNKVYGEIVLLDDIFIQEKYSEIGADTWIVEVYAHLQQKRLTYRIEV